MRGWVYFREATVYDDSTYNTHSLSLSSLRLRLKTSIVLAHLFYTRTCSGCRCRYFLSMETSEAIVAATTTPGLSCPKRVKRCNCRQASVSCLYHLEAKHTEGKVNKLQSITQIYVLHVILQIQRYHGTNDHLTN